MPLADSRMILNRTFCIILCGTIALLTACTKQSEPIHVSGTVTYRGQPVPKGVILIHPNRQQGNSGPFGIAIISNGKFDTKELKGRGAPPGPVMFAVTGYDNGGTAEDFTDAPILFSSFKVDKEIGLEPNVVDIAVP
jgi:hypothetical protein